jgi:predicted metal-dependent peptidase
MEDLLTKLSAARTRLILDKPFLGALVLRLPMIAAGDWCKTTATDARSFYYNPEYIRGLNIHQIQFVLAHEALHCALTHFNRREHRNKHRWDVACDFAINPILVADGLTPPQNALLLPVYEGMTAEEIYPMIDENDNAEPQDQHLYDDTPDDDPDSGSEQDDTPTDASPQPTSNPPPSPEGEVDEQQSGRQPQALTEDEKQTLETQWQQRLAGAAQQAQQAGKLSGALARLVDDFLEPCLPWRMLLARYLTAIARDDYTYQRPSSRRSGQGDAIFPGMRSSHANVVIAVDTSSSVSDDEVQQFLSEINALKGQLRARITLLAIDDQLSENSPWIFESWEEMQLPEAVHGGGGTSFIPAFDYIATLDQAPDMLVYFTDADGTFPSHPPAYPTLWLVKGKTPVPWGERLQLNQ